MTREGGGREVLTEAFMNDVSSVKKQFTILETSCGIQSR